MNAYKVVRRAIKSIYEIDLRVLMIQRISVFKLHVLYEYQVRIKVIDKVLNKKLLFLGNITININKYSQSKRSDFYVL